MISIASGASHVQFCDIDPQAISELTNNLLTNLPNLEKFRQNFLDNSNTESNTLYTISNIDWTQLHHPNTNDPILILASEVVYDAIVIEQLVDCIHRLIAQNGSMLFCQSRHGRGRAQEFIHLMTHSPYNYQFTEFNDFLDSNHDDNTNEKQLLEQFQHDINSEKEYIFGIFFSTNKLI